VKLTTHLYLVPRSREHGSIYPLPHMSSLRSAYLSTRTVISFFFTFLRAMLETNALNYAVISGNSHDFENKR
jgi:hypothetical protein